MGLAHSPRIVTDGLVLCLDAANQKSYPGTGTVWTDLSGNGNNGTLTNGPTYSSANSGSIVFDGVDDYALITNSSPLGQSLNWTINAWVKYNSTGYTSWMIITDQATYTSASNYMMWLSSDAPATGKLLSAYDGGWHYGTIRLYPDIWYNVCLTRQSNVVRYYINGAFDIQKTLANTLTLNTGNVGIGSHPNNLGYRTNGNISSVKIYNRVLSDQEVQQNFNALRGRYGL
jgi:hypothetical protein